MHDTRELVSALLSLADPAVRVQWLRQRLEQWPSAMAAHALQALIEQSENGQAASKQVMFSVVATLLRDPDAPLWRELKAQAVENDLLSLQRLLRQDEPLANSLDAENEPPVPDYGTGRELTLGERRSLARRPQRKWLERLLQDPHPMVIELLLKNPKLTESDLVRIATSRRTRADIFHSIVRAERWLSQGRIRWALIMNPATPIPLTVPLLFLCTRPELREARDASNLPLTVRSTAAELLQRRPPRKMLGTDSRTLH
ncbi:MAG TPA: hypothetical protein VHO25_07960 [Polyangiaceae bacterium]|nr:hypothetical protein [Polyangiaceae bacterium]